MAEPWAFAGESASLDVPGGTVTLIEGSSFCLSGRSGDVWPGSAHGLFVADVRVLSRLELALNGTPPEPLTVVHDNPFTATFVARSRPVAGRADSPLLVFRRRHVGLGLREDVTVRNCGRDELALTVTLVVDADFASLFEVKEGRADPAPQRERGCAPGRLTFGTDAHGIPRKVTFGFGGEPVTEPGTARWQVTIPAGGEWSTCFDVTAAIAGTEIAPRYRCGEPVSAAVPVTRLETWRSVVPTLDTDHETLHDVVHRSLEDLGGLRMFDPDHPDRTVVAAGAPWFMALFGRDSLLTSYMSLIVDPRLAQGVLETLADFQGTVVNPDTEEQPGRILHELRFGRSSTLSLGGGQVYYGSVDATPLFVMLLGELRRWGLAEDVVDRLLPHADRAIEWIEKYGDRDGDGYVEYLRLTPRGLAHQGWKDSWDGVTYADGRVAEPPVALAEVQGYVYAAYLARAHFADEAGDRALAAEMRARAIDLRHRFNRDFWLRERGWFALGLDANKRPIDALASNMGHCLWTGIVEPRHAAAVAERLLSPEMFGGWGVRTLATSMGAYNPISYHNGSVWPHDNAIIAAGLTRYGFLDQAHRVITGMLDAASCFGGRLPELFSGLGRDELAVPVHYPTSCSPQAWASAAPLLFLRSMLRLDPWVPHGKVWVSPALPVGIGTLTVGRIPVGDQRIRVTVGSGGFDVDGADGAFDMVREPRNPLTAPV